MTFIDAFRTHFGTETKLDNESKPSLLEPESRGGEDAGRGFDFQDYFLVAEIPKLLEWNGFESLINEAIGDIEVKFFSPGYGENIELIEAKNYRLTPVVFWKEILRFYTLTQESPGTFRWFRLVATELSDDLAGLQNGLRRIRSPYGFYPEDSGIVQNSFDDFTRLVLNAGKPPEYARFIFEHVLIETGYGAIQANGEAIFRQNFGEQFPEYLLNHSQFSVLYQALLRVVSVRNTPISRKVLEDLIRSHIPDSQLRPYPPIHLYTTIHKEDSSVGKQLVFNGARFFDRTSASYPPVEEWNIGVVQQLIDVKHFVLNQRHGRELHVNGNRRLCVSLAIGAIFSATSGFSISMTYREGNVWQTNDHAGANENEIAVIVEASKLVGDDLIVSIGIPNDIRSPVTNFLHAEGMQDLPYLNIYYPHAVASARQANAIVAQTKKAVIQALASTGANRIHLFLAVPAFIALLVGHRLNATAVVQCYEFISANQYVPTCTIYP